MLVQFLLFWVKLHGSGIHNEMTILSLLGLALEAFVMCAGLTIVLVLIWRVLVLILEKLKVLIGVIYGKLTKRTHGGPDGTGKN